MKPQIHLAAQEVGETQRGANSEYGKSDTFKSHCHTCNNGCGGTCQRCGGNFTHGTPRACGVVLRDVHKGDAKKNAGSTGKAKPDPAWESTCWKWLTICELVNIEEQEAAQEDTDDREETGDEIADVELIHGDFTRIFAGCFVRLGNDGGANPEQAKRGSDQAKGADNQREENPANVICRGKQGHTQDHRSDIFGCS